MTRPHLVSEMQDKKATLLRLRKMTFGRKSEKRKKADPESSQDEEKKDVACDTGQGNRSITALQIKDLPQPLILRART